MPQSGTKVKRRSGSRKYPGAGRLQPEQTGFDLARGLISTSSSRAGARDDQITLTKTKDLNRLIRFRIVVTCILSFPPWRHLLPTWDHLGSRQDAFHFGEGQ